MAYEARRTDDDEEKEAKRAQSDATNAKVVRMAAKAGEAAPEPIIATTSKVINTADKLTGGKGSEIVGKALTRANEMTPTGNITQSALNKVGETGALDVADKAMSMKNKKGGQEDGSPSSSDKKPEPKENKEEVKEETPKDDNKDSNNKTNIEGSGSFKKIIIPIALICFLPVFLISMILLMLLSTFSDYTDAFGISEISGLDTGGISNVSSDPDQVDFYNRVNEVKLEYQSEGKEVDPLIITSVYHALNSYKNTVTYKKMTTDKIRAIADAMLNNNVYDKEYFINNLKTTIIPSYFPLITNGGKDEIVEEIFNYIDRYNDLIGKQESKCSSGGSCTYEIKGYQLNSTKSVSKNVSAKNIYVRLMQCGGNWGGTAGQPIAGEELVPLEKYVLGSAYAEMGDISSTSNAENKFKTQLVVARSFVLSRHADVGGWRSLKEENGKWIIQIGNCTRDQLYCDPDKGCSKSKSTDFHLYSGTGKNSGTYKTALSENHPYRKYAEEVTGEVLVNNKGYIIQTAFLMGENSKFNSLAESGYNYKQILLNVYNSGRTNYGASGIYKANCGNTCVTNTEVEGWKQYDATWGSVRVGTSGKTIKQIGCLATALAIQIARSGVSTNISDFNPGTFVTYLNSHGGFYGGDLNWSGPTAAAPTFVYQNTIDLSHMNRTQKLEKIKEITSQSGVYAVCEVKGNTGQHWVAVDSVNGTSIKMMDPGSTGTDMWKEYNWANTSRIVYYRVVR